MFANLLSSCFSFSLTNKQWPEQAELVEPDGCRPSSWRKGVNLYMGDVDWVARGLALASLTIHGYCYWKSRAHISVAWKYSADAYEIVAMNDGKKPVMTKWVKVYSNEGRLSVLTGTAETNMQMRLAPGEQALVRVYMSSADTLMSAERITVLDSRNREWELEDLIELKEHCRVVQYMFFKPQAPLYVTTSATH